MVNYSQSLVALLFLQHNALKYAKHWIEIRCWTAITSFFLRPHCEGAEQGGERDSLLIKYYDLETV